MEKVGRKLRFFNTSQKLFERLEFEFNFFETFFGSLGFFEFFLATPTKRAFQSSGACAVSFHFPCQDVWGWANKTPFGAKNQGPRHSGFLYGLFKNTYMKLLFCMINVGKYNIQTGYKLDTLL